MSSTGFYIGLDETKGSRKAMKPQGGGHTDIFGIRGDNNELQTPSKRKNYPPTTINSCLNMDEEKPIEKVEFNGNSDHTMTDENTAPTKEPENDDKEIKKEDLAPTKVRVPPGGFSSGFW